MHYEYNLSKIVTYAVPRKPQKRTIDALKRPLRPYRPQIYRPAWFMHLYPQTEQKHIFHALNLSEDTKKQFIENMKFVNYKYANATFTTSNKHYGIEAKVSGSGNIISMTIDSEENQRKFEEVPKRQRALMLQSLVLEACNKAGELKRKEMKVVYQQLFEDLYLNCEAAEEAEARQRTVDAMQRASERGFDARGMKLQSAVSNMVNRERERGGMGITFQRGPRRDQQGQQQEGEQRGFAARREQQQQQGQQRGDAPQEGEQRRAPVFGRPRAQRDQQ